MDKPVIKIPTKKKFYIVERHNPQFNKPYYILLGQLSKSEAKKHEHTIYGMNIVLSYYSEGDYNKAIEDLKKNNFNVH